MKCCFTDCTAQGEPMEGFDFFACDDCLILLADAIEREYVKNAIAGARSVGSRN